MLKNQNYLQDLPETLAAIEDKTNILFLNLSVFHC